ncbi:MAG: DUF2807 domain-containing protein [Emcibacter sp.]|nr:DUF2807 domain-containing protein [Emcibacter sp.]
MGYLKLFGIATFAIGMILYLASADDHKIVKGEQHYPIGDYEKISVDIPADLNIIVGQDYSLNIEADEKDIENLRLYVKGQTLVLEYKKGYSNGWQRHTPKITMSLPLLRKITLNSSAMAKIESILGNSFKAVINGSGTIDISGESEALQIEINGSGTLRSASFQTKESDVHIDGSGLVVLKGDCDKLSIDINGSGEFSGKNFICHTADVDISGSSNIEVYASDTLEVDVSGSGDVNVFGHPKQIRDHSDKKKHVIIQ